MALRFLAPRPRSEAEVRRRLARAAIADDDVERVLAELRQRGLIDDVAFADYWVDQRQTFRPRGARLVQAELRQHGIGSQVATTAVTDMATSAVDDALRAVARRAERLATQVDRPTFDSRLSSFLARRGFDWPTISSVLQRLHTPAEPQ